jgi:hypothetical protein
MGAESLRHRHVSFSVLLFLPVIATLDRASFVLLRQPNHQLLLLKLAIEKLT